MTLPLGQIAMSQINVELGVPANASLGMNNAAVRALAGLPFGVPIGFSQFHGKAVPAPAPAPAPGPAPAPAPTIFSYVMVPGYAVDSGGGEGSFGDDYTTGYSTVRGIGTLTPTTFPAGTEVLGIFATHTLTTSSVVLYTTGAHLQFSAFSVLNINGTLFFPGDAFWQIPSDNRTLWTWVGRGYQFTTGAPTAIAVTGV